MNFCRFLNGYMYKKKKKRKEEKSAVFLCFYFAFYVNRIATTHIVTSTPITCYLLILRSPLGAFHCGTFSGAYAIARLSRLQYGCRLRGSAIGR